MIRDIIKGGQIMAMLAKETGASNVEQWVQVGTAAQ